MNKNRMLSGLLALAMGVTACTTPTPAAPTPTATAPTPTAESTAPPASPVPVSDLPRYEAVDCWFDIPSGQAVECGYVTVPEDRAQPDGPTIQLAVARFKGTGAEPDPIVYLEGGPGGSVLRSGIEQFDQIFEPLVGSRDLILFDQRGTGFSEPALDCPEYKEWALSVLDQDLSAEESERLGNEVLLVCRSRLAQEGVNLAAYNSAENAADLDAIRMALGIDQWNLYGISYGTRLALTAMRDHPEGLRSVVIDSVVPPQTNLYSSIPVNAERAFEVLFQACESDPDCRSDFPDLRQRFFDLVDQLNEQPIVFPVKLKSGETRDMLMNGDGMMSALFQYLYITSFLPFLPRLIEDVRAGDYQLVAYLQGELLSQLDDISYGMHFSVQCGEEVPFDTPEAIAQAIEQNPEYEALAGPGVFELCDGWDVGTAPDLENEAVSSDIATLVLSGQFDPITPPAWGRLAADSLPRGFFIELPNAGHGASLTGGDCPRNVVLEFVGNPEDRPDSSCVLEDMAKIQFAAPANSQTIRLAPFSDSAMGFSGVRPEGWKQVAPGVYTPTGELTDATGLVLQVVPIGPGFVVQAMESQFEQAGLDTPLERTGTRQANGLEWELYSAVASIIAIDLAVAEQDGQTYMVMMQTLVDERDQLAESVFLPAIDALQPAP